MSFSLAPPKYDLKFNHSDVKNWPRTRTSLTFFANQASASMVTYRSTVCMPFITGSKNRPVPHCGKDARHPWSKTALGVTRKRIVLSNTLTINLLHPRTTITWRSPLGRKKASRCEKAATTVSYCRRIRWVLVMRSHIPGVSQLLYCCIFFLKELELKTKLLG